MVYIDTHIDNSIIRTFTRNVDVSELVWHRDRKDRTIRVLQGCGWQFQYDNELPFEMTRDLIFSISKETYHRILKGDGDLVIEITEE